MISLCWQDAFPLHVIPENRFQRTATLLLYLNDVAEVLFYFQIQISKYPMCQFQHRQMPNSK